MIVMLIPKKYFVVGTSSKMAIRAEVPHLFVKCKIRRLNCHNQQRRNLVY